MTDYQNILKFVIWKLCSIDSSRPRFPAWRSAAVGEASKLCASSIFPCFSKYSKRHHYFRLLLGLEGAARIDRSKTPEADALFQRIIEPNKGNGLYIDFWDWGCGPCRRGMLDNREKVERMKDLPVRFLYVCSEKNTPRYHAEKWMQENDIKGEHIYLTHTEWLQLCEKFQFNALPFYFAVDKDGNIVTFDDLSKYYQALGQ